MSRKILLTATEVAKILEISEAHAYKIIRNLNKELEAKGFIVIAGKVNIRYFKEKLYISEGEIDNVGTQGQKDR